MRDTAVFLIILCTIIIATIIGVNKTLPSQSLQPVLTDNVPHIGKIQILNGCGIAGCAGQAADILRARGFDVKNDGIGNATSFNYPFTIVVARTRDMDIARQVGKSLNVAPDRIMLIRNGDNRFDITVILGTDFKGKTS
jgi:hypothetical protein